MQRKTNSRRFLVPQAMDAMLDHVELTCEVSYALDGVMDEVEGARALRLHGRLCVCCWSRRCFVGYVCVQKVPFTPIARCPTA